MNAPPRLLTRTAFREAVLARDQHRCVACGATGKPLDAHHIVERRLFDDGGYYLENGASLCDPDCHVRAESTVLGCDELRRLCGIARVVLPPHVYPDDPIDKWGNGILPSGMRLRGELFHDASVQAVLAPVLHLFTRLVKPARTWHLPGSPGGTADDRRLADTHFFEGQEVVVTAKMDGENTSVYGQDGYTHARSVTPSAHWSTARMKALAAELGPDLLPDWRLNGENLTAKHTIHYTHLRPHPRWFFQVFNLWTPANECLAWDAVIEWATLLDLPIVPVLYRGLWDPKVVRSLFQRTFEDDAMEGYVVRRATGFPFRDYRRAVAKFVRADHVAAHGRDWHHGPPVSNAPRAT